MNQFYKQLIFITLGVAIVVTGGLAIWAVNNRGDEPYIYIRFDEGYGSTVYDSMNSNDGTIVNAVWKTEEECKIGKCLYFDGTGDYVSIPDFDLD